MAHPPTERTPTATVESTRAVTVIAAASLILAGLSLAAYALTGFTTRDWTVAGPGLLVAAAGVVGLRNRWFHLGGLVPIGAVLTVAGPILAYDLARPDETQYFIGSAAIILGACLAAIFGVASAVEDRRALRAGLIASLVMTPIVFVGVVGANPASADVSAGIADADRVDALEVEMIDVAFVVEPIELAPGVVIHLRNSGTLPHDFTIGDLDVAVFVPPGRSTYLRLPASSVDSVELVCTVGDHFERGMRLTIGPT